MSTERSGGELVKSFVLDSSGMPTSPEACKLIGRLFDNRHQPVHLAELSEILGVPQNVIRVMCRQLELLDLVVEEPPLSRRYRYKLDCCDFELQAKVESAILDCQNQRHAPDQPGVPPEQA